MPIPEEEDDDDDSEGIRVDCAESAEADRFIDEDVEDVDEEGR